MNNKKVAKELIKIAKLLVSKPKSMTKGEVVKFEKLKKDIHKKYPFTKNIEDLEAIRALVYLSNVGGSLGLQAFRDGDYSRSTIGYAKDALGVLKRLGFDRFGKKLVQESLNRQWDYLSKRDPKMKFMNTTNKELNEKNLKNILRIL